LTLQFGQDIQAGSGRAQGIPRLARVGYQSSNYWNIEEARLHLPLPQSIGFYLERAGLYWSDQILAKGDGVKFDFYLSHGLDNLRSTRLEGLLPQKAK